MLAIILTIMVLEMKVPHEPTLAALTPPSGRFSSASSLSFVFIGIYWNNHHPRMHLVHAIGRDFQGKISAASYIIAIG